MSSLAHDTRTPCQDDPGLFHAPDREGGRDRVARESAAKAICATCPAAVKADCLQIAMTAERGNGAQHREGLYGGLTPTERAVLDGRAVAPKPKPRVPAECGTAAGYYRHLRAGEVVCIACSVARSEQDRARRSKAAG